MVSSKSTATFANNDFARMSGTATVPSGSTSDSVAPSALSSPHTVAGSITAKPGPNLAMAGKCETLKVNRCVTP
jgi:hypothetical protein